MMNALGTRKKPSLDEFRVMAEALSRLLTGGVPLLKAMSHLLRMNERMASGPLLRRVLERVEQGKSLSEAFGEWNGVLPTYWTPLFQAGEVSGATPEIATAIARYIEKRQALKRKVEEALFYPLLVCAAGCLTLGVLLGVVIPRMELVYQDFGRELPRLTQAVLWISDYFPFLGAGVFFASGIFWGWAQKKRERWLRLLTAFPFVRGVFYNLVEVQFARLLALLLKSGIPLLTALEVVRGTFSIEEIQKNIQDIKIRLAGGASLSQSMREVAWIREISRLILSAGEESGQMVEALSSLADDSARKVEQSLHGIVKILEPLALLVVGGIVGGVVVAVLLPVFDLGNVVQ